MNENSSKAPGDATEAITEIRNGVEREFASLRVQHPRFFRLAVNEAEALAWQSGVPQLLLPELAAEKIRKLAAWQIRQNHLKQSWALSRPFRPDWIGVNN